MPETKTTKAPLLATVFYLPDLARFIRDHHLDTYTSRQIELSREYDLPLLKYFTTYSEDQLKEVTRGSVSEFLNSFVENKIENYIQEVKDNWIADQLPYLIKKDAIETGDLVLVSLIRKRNLTAFVPLYTQDLNIQQKLYIELDNYFTYYNQLFTEVYINILKEKVTEATEKKLADDLLKESEQRFRSLIENSNDAITLTDATGKFLYASPAIARILGYQEHEILQINNFELFHADDSKIVEEAATILNEAGKTKTVVVRIKHRNGSWRWVESTFTNLLHVSYIGAIVSNIRDITEQKLAEEALKKSEEQFRQLADSMPQMVWAALPDGSMEYFNKRWVEYTGVSLDTIVPSWDSIIHPDDVPTSKSAWENSLGTGEPFEVEYRMKNKTTGDYRWFLVRSVPIKNQNGITTKWFGTCTDIHENKEKDQFLKLQARIIDSMAEGVMVLDEHGYIQYTNAAQDKMTGYEPGELVGKHATILNTQQDESSARKAAADLQVLKENGSVTTEWHNKRKDGSLFYTESFTTTLDRDGKKQLVSVQRDITEERKNKQMLEESEKLFRMLAEQSPSLIWMSDDKGNVIYCNKELLDYAGFSSISAFSELKQEGVIHPSDLEATYDAYKIGHEELKPFSLECKLKQASTGLYRRFIFKGVPRFSDGKFNGFIGSAIDIEEQMKTADELEERVQDRTKELLEANAKLAVSNRELEQFAYVASHDLQEPLRKIQAFGDILNNRYKAQLEESGRDMINRMQSAADRMKILIEDLLAYSRVSRKVDMEQVDINKITREVIGDLYTSIMEKKAKVDVQHLWPIKGNALHLRQLFQNLIGNALKFSREGITPEITVTSQLVNGSNSGFALHGEAKNQQYQLIEIKDNGIGFEQQYAEKIFQMFQRLHGRAEYAGSGVGLSIVQKVVENHQGQVQAIGNPGEGATFKILFPLCDDDNARSLETAASEGSQPELMDA